MHASLLCAEAHPLFPILQPGNTLALLTDGLPVTFQMPTTPRLIRRLAQAIRDGAIRLTDPPLPWDEIEADIYARRDELLGAIEVALRARAASRLAG